MEYLIIGDLHGRSHWKDLLNKYPNHNIVFVGDLLDSFNIPIDTQIRLLQDVIVLVKSNPTKYELLIGNHEYHYLSFISDKYSGYNGVTQTLFSHIQEEYLSIAKVCTEHKGYLISHAGVHRGWYAKLLLVLKNTNIKIKDVVTNINNSLKYRLTCLGDVSKARGGLQQVGSPIWLCKSESRKLLKEYKHIVGHTQISEVKTIDNITYIDTGNENAFIII